MEINHITINNQKLTVEITKEHNNSYTITSSIVPDDKKNILTPIHQSIHAHPQPGHTASHQVVFKLNEKIYHASIYEYFVHNTKTYSIALHNSPHQFEVSNITHEKIHTHSNITNHEARPILPARLEPPTPHVCPDNNSDLSLRSPLAGLVVKILVQEGDHVTQNQPLFIVESMKMENEISAPYDAIIKTLSIHEGNLVQPNEVVIVFERRGGSDNATTKDVHQQKDVERPGDCTRT